MQEILNQFLIPVVLELITEDVIFVKKFKEFAPSIEDKIESFSKNSNCSCRGTVVSYIQQNHESIKNFVSYFLSENPQVKINLEEIVKKNSKKDVRGQVFRVPKNDNAFFQFYQHIKANNFEFSQFSVSQEGDFWVIFFL